MSQLRFYIYIQVIVTDPMSPCQFNLMVSVSSVGKGREHRGCKGRADTPG